MSGARNKVIAGAYEGKYIGRDSKSIYIIQRPTETIELNTATVAKTELIDTSSEINVPSAAIRGFIGEMLFGPIGLAAAGMAKRSERYIVSIKFADAQESVLELDDELYGLLIASLSS